MADTDVLPPRGVPVLALVDGTGIAVNGSQTVAQLAARGIRSACAVDATGTALNGSSVAQLAAAGIRAFCPVNENGLAQDAVSTVDMLRMRGIRPRVLLDASGVALNGSAGVLALRQRGLECFCPVDESGNATTMGAVILISNTNVFDNIAVGATVGTLSVAGGSGTYTFTLTSNPGSLFATAGTNGVNLNTAAALAAGSYPVTVQAAGGVPTPISRSLSITVNQSPVIPANTALPVISGSTVVGQTLTTTNGTWTGFPAPGFTYQWQRDLSTTDPATTAWVAAVVTAGGTVSGARQTAVDTFIKALKTAGIWATMDRYWLLAGEDAGSAGVDMVAGAPLTLAGTPAFTPNKGYVPSSANYINTGYAPDGTSSQYRKDTATIGMFVNTVMTGSSYIIGAANGAFDQISGIQLNGFGAGLHDARLNTSSDASGGFAAAGSRGSIILTRNGSSTVAPIYFNGSAYDTLTAPTTGLPGVNFFLGAINQGGSPVAYGATSQMSDFVAGGGWSAAQVTAFYNAQTALMTAIGVLP